ncbi:hypothetical protein OK016_19590 [Vibrio chagasii]|nr:hypothetical protein [Vibrio chagasii]
MVNGLTSCNCLDSTKMPTSFNGTIGHQQTLWAQVSIPELVGRTGITTVDVTIKPFDKRASESIDKLIGRYFEVCGMCLWGSFSSISCLSSIATVRITKRSKSAIFGK